MVAGYLGVSQRVAHVIWGITVTVPGCDLNCMVDLWGLERTRSTNEDDSHENRSTGIL